MKILIVYYSQTGNTQKVARAIRDGMRDEGHEVDLRFIKNVEFSELEAYDMIGFGSPIWFEAPPVMRKFTEEMPGLAGKAGFAFCTHGTLPDLYFPLVVPRLQSKGLTMLGWKGWYGNCSVQVFPEPYYTAGHPDAVALEDAAAFGKELCAKAEKWFAGDSSVEPPTPMPCMSLMHANVAIMHLGGLHNIHGALIRDPQKCLYPKCTICMDNCPMDYIDLKSGRFGRDGDKCDDCHSCTYCELICPSGAIKPITPYEELAPVGEYHGSELFIQTLSKAEEEGRFRRVIPFEEVGVRTPLYSVKTKHPRVKPLRFDED